MTDKQSEWYKLQNEILTICSTVVDEEMYGAVLELILDRFESPLGYFGYINDDNALVCPSMTRDVWDRCDVPEKSIVFPRESWGGLWGESLITGKTIHSQAPMYTPEGHIPITRAVAVPLMFRDMVVGQIVIANKPREYTEMEIENLNDIARLLAPVLNARIERDRALQREREARLNAEEANELKSSFLAGMSHEIRTPLNALLGFQDIVLDHGGLDPEYRSYLEQAKQSGYMLLHIINDLLDLSKIEAGKMNLQQVPFSLSSVLKNVYSIARMNLEKSGKELELRPEIPKQSDIYLKGDPRRLEEVLSNLITNAIKFTDEGYIEYGASFDDKNSIRFYVTDTGIGIPPEKQTLIFDSFRQAERKIKQKYGGTGLGLAISKNLVEMMGGSMTLDSTPGEGSTFSFTIPYREAKSRAVEEKTSSKSAAGEKGLVLVVDDNRINRKVVQTMLQKEGFEVMAAGDGEEAVDLIRKTEEIGLVFMDMYMPNMDGIEATQHIRSWEQDQGRDSVPIIALTAAGTSEDRRLMEDAGSNDFHPKPIDKAVLLKQIKRFL